MNNMTVSFAPHIRENTSTTRIMLDVLIALAPAFIASILIFGGRSALVVGVCVASCVFFEWLFQKITRRKSTINDLSACITGVLLAFNLPHTIVLWQAIFGSAVAIILVKQLFGGIGKNFANPAITARIVMFISFPATMSAWTQMPDAVTSATPLSLIQSGDLVYLPGMMDMFLGIRGGSLGETSALALLLGGAYLLFRRVITWHIPVTFIGTVFVFTALLGQQPSYQILAGGLILGAFFMATDYPTSPQTAKGRIIFGVGAGLLTVLIRVYGSYPEGVSFAILFMNVLVPFINKFTMTKPLGGVKKA